MAIPLVHPIRKWRKTRSYTAADVAALVAARGRKCSKRYIDAIEMGQRRPSYEICEILEALSEGEIKIAIVRHWPLHAEKRAA